MTVLEGVRVVDLTEYIAGPYGTMLLGDLGADVIKVEPPGGDRWRQGRFYAPHESKNNLAMNRSKRSIALDLTTEDGLAVFYRLVKTADVLAHNFRPGVAERLGIGYETLAELNPCIVYCHNSAFGAKGPLASKGGYDILSTAATGFLTGPAGRIEEGRLTAGVGLPIADISSAIFQALAICAALWRRERDGMGQKIDVSLFGAGIAVQNTRFFSAERYDREERETFLAELRHLYDAHATIQELLAARPEPRVTPGAVIYFRVYETKDLPIAVACLNDKLRKRCADVMGIHDPRFDELPPDLFSPAYQQAARLLSKDAEAVMRTRTYAEWAALFDAEDVPCGPVNFIEELHNDPQALANGLVVELDHPTVGPLRTAGPPFVFHRTPLNIHRPPPMLSEHSDEILKELGYTQEQVAELRTRRIVT